MGTWADIFAMLSSMVNRGLAGDTTTGMLRRIDTNVECEAKAGAFLWRDKRFSAGYDVEHIYQNYIDMLKVWQENDIRILVQSTLYVASKLQGLNCRLNCSIAKISEYCTCNKALRS